jgi:Family of unknown function (DUF6335)
MAKRKAAGKGGRKSAGRAGRSGKTRQKVTRRRAARKAAPRKGRKTRARKVTARKTVARKATARTGTARRAGPARKGVSARKKSPAARARAIAKPGVGAAGRVGPAVRKAPALNRERRTIADEELLPSPPSTLDLDRSASSARSGRRELRERFDEHTETGPAMTGGDVDADWESAYTVGDEAPGGDNPTPDQDIVDDIGRAVGVEYQDNEELKGDQKIARRDRRRWELDPASSEDYEDR